MARITFGVSLYITVMKENEGLHTFHIPVMGLGYTIDTPVKVARFGISSVVSIIEDVLVEQMRKIHCKAQGEHYIPITDKMPDYRAVRITAYLDLLERIVNSQVEKLRCEQFIEGTDLWKYFILLPDQSPLRKIFNTMLSEKDEVSKVAMQNTLRKSIRTGAIDVNIMTKCDRPNYGVDGQQLESEYSDALAALRGFAKSTLSSAVVFSAGLNPRLYTYCETFPDFYPDATGKQKKKIILKVSDYRSALIQGKFLAKKGLWISEFRIESGLNCGGHAFATQGILLGPILQEFMEKRDELSHELFSACEQALQAKNIFNYAGQAPLQITVQGGIGTAAEQEFLFSHYHVDRTGWGSPFLLVPEATNVDEETLQKLVAAKKEDYYLSQASPLGVAFNNFRQSSSETQRLSRIAKGRPGSPCYKGFLGFNTEFTEKPICTASREYQHLKLKQLNKRQLLPDEYAEAYEAIVSKDCLCEGLGTSALTRNGETHPKRLSAIAICPGPNLAYFSGVFTLAQMVDHVYGRADVLNKLARPHMFVNELIIYVDYLKTEMKKKKEVFSAKQTQYLQTFHANLLEGVSYYKALFQAPQIKNETTQTWLESIETSLRGMLIPGQAELV
jgi:hypothetical protein